MADPAFDKWLREYRLPAPAPELPEGIWEQGGKYMAECVACERADEIPCDISEIPATGYRHYCGGSPRCCP